MKRSAQEINEIERHKYFLSEKQGYDVGWDYAERDWELNHAAQFRRQHPLASVGECCSTTSVAPPTAAQSSCCQSTPAATQVSTIEARPTATTNNGTVVRKDPPARSHEGGPLRWLLARLFQHQSSS